MSSLIIDEARKQEHLIVANKMLYERLRLKLKETLDVHEVTNLIEIWHNHLYPILLK